MVTGASRGFGLEIVRRALDGGDAVVACARRPEEIVDNVDATGAADRLMTAVLDVTDTAQVEAAVESAVARFGRIDIVVNNAGRGMVGAVEEVTDGEARALFDVNVFGVLTVTRAVLPVLRRQRSGHVIMMSSMGGFSQPGAGWGIYGASKFAVEGFSEALRNEVSPLGIAVTLVEPGVFRTDFLDGSSLDTAREVIADYADTAGRTRDGAVARNRTQQGDPAKAAAAIIDVAGRPDAPLRLPLGADAVAAMEAKMVAVSADLDATRAVATATAFS
ncbi:SDR family NAD(P)-dependent oxidoreductase [Williamsia sp. MIQD14]|uniref:SDR family NAD(P)-dependent oxidoreductase n=1 Tax=Williamsia sp. MIQD14 TaxID=3425703 RepID=UPI003DA06158